MIPIRKKTKNKPALKALSRSKTGWFAILFLAGLTFLSQHHIFFWDTIQFAGKHGQWFFDQDFHQWLLPESIDSGHPPVFGWLLAAVWGVFGKNLAVSHWAMFPFLLGIVWQLLRFGHKYLKAIPLYGVVFIVLLDPVMAGQYILVSPDVVLIFFFLLGLNSLLDKQVWWLALACLGMTAISTRGMMIVAAFGLYQLIVEWPVLKKWDLRSWWNVYGAYLPAAFFSLAFLWVHYRQSGWIGYHADSPWAPNFERVSGSGLLRNLVIFGWRWLDYGRVFLWGIGAFLVYKHWDLIRGKSGDKPFNVKTDCNPSLPYKMTVLVVCLTALLSLSFLAYRGLHAHRYLLPAFITFSFCLLIGIGRLENTRLKHGLLSLVLVALLTGNLWIYPERIAQGWDATLAHWPYYSLREELLDYLEEARIPLDEVGTAFPDIGPLNDRDLSGRTIGFKEKSLATDQYIFYSNIMNDFSDDEIDALYRDWQPLAHFRRMGVFITLFQKSERGR